mgnify:CR=1 FL=1
MGLPELTFSLKKAADNVAARVSSGIVAMILRDAKANGLHTINRESDIPRRSQCGGSQAGHDGLYCQARSHLSERDRC